MIALHGGGHTGRGEDVTYEARGPGGAARRRPGAASWRASRPSTRFSEHLATLDTFPGFTPEQAVYRRYRRWGFESAALDLALRQDGHVAARGARPRREPVTFVVSSRMGDPPTLDPVTRRLARLPGLRFKLDATPDWTRRADRRRW